MAEILVCQTEHTESEVVTGCHHFRKDCSNRDLISELRKDFLQFSDNINRGTQINDGTPQDYLIQSKTN